MSAFATPPLAAVSPLLAQPGLAELVRSADRVPSGALRLETVFRYPDGASIDVFVTKPQAEGEPLVLSDFGQTFDWLAQLPEDPRASKAGQELLAEVIALHGAVERAGAREREVGAATRLAEGVVELAQLCIRAADLAYTRRPVGLSSARHRLEALLQAARVPFMADAEVEGRFGVRVPLEFLVQGVSGRAGVLMLSPESGAHAHERVNEVFRRWYDLEGAALARITVFDDRVDLYREDDLRRLREVSTLVPLSDSRQLRAVLAA